MGGPLKIQIGRLDLSALEEAVLSGQAEAERMAWLLQLRFRDGRDQ